MKIVFLWKCTSKPAVFSAASNFLEEYRPFSHPSQYTAYSMHLFSDRPHRLFWPNLGSLCLRSSLIFILNLLYRWSSHSSKRFLFPRSNHRDCPPLFLWLSMSLRPKTLSKERPQLFDFSLSLSVSFFRVSTFSSWLGMEWDSESETTLSLPSCWEAVGDGPGSHCLTWYKNTWDGEWGLRVWMFLRMHIFAPLSLFYY